jgi:ribose transport system substrate-binding protein
MNSAIALVSSSVLVASALPLLNCARPQHAADETYVLIVANVKIPYWQAAAAGLKQAAGQLHVRSEVVGPDTYNPEAQKREFQKVLSGKPAGIMVSAADPLLLKPEIDAAVARGIPVITIDSDALGSKRLLFIGTNNYEAGRLGGQIAAEQLKSSGNVVVFTMPEQMNLRDRLLGYESMFSGHPGIKIVQVIDIKGDPRVAFDKTTEIIQQKKPKVDAFVCMEALACAEVAEALSRNQIKDKIVVAMDTDPRTLEWITKGAIAATVAQRPFTMAAFGLRILDSLHHNKLPSLEVNLGRETRSPLPKFIDTGTIVVDKGNVDEFVRQAEDSKTQ